MHRAALSLAAVMQLVDPMVPLVNACCLLAHGSIFAAMRREAEKKVLKDFRIAYRHEARFEQQERYLFAI